jgi:hypothetical protein
MRRSLSHGAMCRVRLDRHGFGTRTKKAYGSNSNDNRRRQGRRNQREPFLQLLGPRR